MTKDWKLTGRLMGFLHKRLKELDLDDVDDPRDKRGRRWKLSTILGAVIAGIICGQKCLHDVEEMTQDL